MPNSETGAVPSNPIPGSDWVSSQEPMWVKWMDNDVIGVPMEQAADEPTGTSSDPIMQAMGKADTFKLSAQRADGFNYGGGWQGRLPQSYFDGVRIVNALRQIAHDASKRHWAGETALRNLRLAETNLERADAITALQLFITSIDGDKELNIRMLVNDLADTIDAAAPTATTARVLQMELHSAMKPLRSIIDRIKAAFGASDA